MEESPVSFNRYAYANNNPYKFVDPDGNFAVLAIPAYTLAEYAVVAILGSIVAKGIEEKIVTPAIQAHMNKNEEPEEEATDQEPEADGVKDSSNVHSPDRQALNDIIRGTTLGGRKPLSNEDADTILDWAGELNVDGARDDRGKDHWEGGEHIHVPGSGIGHIPTEEVDDES